jgi:hypothetical protein
MLHSLQMALPVGCTLSAEALQERKSTIRAAVRNAVLSRSRIPGGYRYEFANDSTTFRQLSRMVELERECCRFLRFGLSETGKTIRLDVSGQPEALVIVEELFG